jgi:glycosyltransferase involved in cell wall biosynthesis
VRWLGLGGLVEFLGHRNDLPEILWKHQVAVISTRREGFGLVAVESMAAGCAVVASRAPGVAELIEHGHTGWLATTGDPVTFADAIAEALGAEGPVRAAAGAAFAGASFGLVRMTTEYERLFEQLYPAKRRPSA